MRAKSFVLLSFKKFNSRDSDYRLLENNSLKNVTFSSLYAAMSDKIETGDFFDDVILSEDKIIEKAFLEGYEKGKKDGEVDGYHNGYHKGGDIGIEIGFYKGVSNAILTNDIARNDKTRQILQKLMESLEKFPNTNNHDVNIWTELNDVRAQYKKLCSLTKLNLPYTTMPKTSF